MIVSVPTGNVEVVTTTLLELIVPEPIVVDPFVKVIVPVTPAGTVAVIVTVCPYVLDDGLAVTVTVGLFFAIVSVSVATDELLLASPL